MVPELVEPSPQVMVAVKSPALAAALSSVKVATTVLLNAVPSVVVNGCAVAVMTSLATVAVEVLCAVPPPAPRTSTVMVLLPECK